MGEFSSKRYLIKNSIATLFRVGVSSVSTLLITPFIIKSIGLDLFGYISLTSFFVSYAGLFDIGISKTLVYLINGKDVTDASRNRYISSFYYINCVIVLGIIIFGFSGILFNIPILGKSVPPGSGYYLIMTTVSVLVLAFSIFNMFQCAMLEGFFKLEKANYGVMLKILILNGLYLINILTVNNLIFYIVSALISVVITTIYYAFVIHSTVKFSFIKISFAEIKKVLKVSLSFAGVGFFSSINSALPMIVVTYLTNGLANIAILNVVNRLSMSVVNLGSSIARPFFALTKKNPDAIRSKWKKFISVYLIGGFSCILFVVIFRNQITHYFFHDESLTPLLNYLVIIYVVAAVIYLIGQPVSMYLMGVGKALVVTKIIAINCIIFIIAFYLFDCILENVLVTLSIANILMAISYTVGLIRNAVKV